MSTAEQVSEARRELGRLRDAILHMADHAPLDLMTARLIQERLHQILGKPHTHKASIGSDACDICLRDIRDHDLPEDWRNE